MVQVVWACVDGERPQAALKGATLELKTLAYVVSVLGSEEGLRTAVSGMIREGVRGLGGKPGAVEMALENVGPVVKFEVRTPGAVPGEGQPSIQEIRRIVETAFGGTLTLASDAVGGTALTMTLPVPSHRFRDPAQWWER